MTGTAPLHGCCLACFSPHWPVIAPFISLYVTSSWRPVKVCLRSDSVWEDSQHKVWSAHWQRAAVRDRRVTRLRDLWTFLFLQTTVTTKEKFTHASHRATRWCPSVATSNTLYCCMTACLTIAAEHPALPGGPIKETTLVFCLVEAASLFASGGKSIPRRSEHIMSKWQRQYYSLRYQCE